MKRTVYIGTEAGQELAAQVLRYTIERRAGTPVAVHFLNRALTDSGVALQNVTSSNTPFSKQRLFVPMLAQSGQAAYLDSDMLVFRDINELFAQARSAAIACCQTRQAHREPQTSVTVFDVAQCQWEPREIVAAIDADPAKYRPYLYEFSFAGGVAHVLPAVWNDLEEFEPSSTCLLHYTDMDTQPWLTSTNRLGDVWLGCLEEAVKAGAVSIELIAEGARIGNVRPSLLWQSRNGFRRAHEIPLSQRVRDVFLFVPPHSLVNGLPGGIGRAAARFFGSRAPRFLKAPLAVLLSTVLLARRRRRLLVKATLTNRTCVINRSVAAVMS